jgi:uncharacterized protein (TIGR03083 family)
MTPEPEQSLSALRRSHDELVSLIGGSDAHWLEHPSGASEWTVAQVLSHLGSAAEIGHHTLTTGQADMAAAPAIWDRWNAMSPEDQASGFVAANEGLVHAYAALSSEDWSTKMVDVGFLPAPIDISFFAGIRLIEVGLHRWDIDVATDAGAAVSDYFLPFILQKLPMLAGFLVKPIGRSALISVTTSDPAGHFVLDLADSGGSLTEGPGSDAAIGLSLPAEAFARLLTGRLGPDHTPSGIAIEGDLTLAELRRASPGF